ncbi:zinc-dependent metalloprotease [Pelagicoccus mobilis]|uniref:Zinc-dependent metalloprotease n=1 Tax=Pelagicoccus mobilis TaxID=415221 RepID=A0A934RT53_9BACT|nr:zinc-dependent metalloprotease [Pelagicoccus mobilis]
MAVFFLACTAQSAKEKAAPALKISEKTRVAIPKSGLGKEYLLSTSLIPQAGAATSRGMEGRVVMFELYEDGVDLYETTKGKVVTEDLPARRLLTTFPIIDDEGGDIVIDFNAGMRRLSYSSWYNRQEGFDARSFERSAELPQARVFETELEDGILTIRQAVQARSRTMDPDLETRYEIRYFLSPYVESDFEPREMHAEETRYARFFAGSSRLELESGRVSKYLSRFDVSEPVVFYYSANTPENMREAVEEGILYWNKALGEKVVEAKMAPEGVTAPHPTMNVVQWVPWDTAGVAYADALIDPLTGETQHGQAYMTSVFEFGGEVRARRLLRTLRAMIDEKSEEKEKEDEESEHVHSSAFGHSVACQFDPIDFALELSDGLEELLADPDLSEEIVERISQDYVRDVTAHEVGHVLGLRHNFAASLSADVTPKELDQFMADYVGGEDLSDYLDKTVSTSVMEYSVFNASVFTGWYIKNGQDALEHDAAAIRWGYFDDKSVVEEKQLFGSEEETLIYADVTRHDYGSGPLEASYDDLSSAIRGLPNSVLERFIAGRAPMNPKDRKSLEAVKLDVSEYAKRISEPVKDMLKWFNKETRSVRVEQDYAFVGDLNQEERWEAHWESLEEQLKELGGIDQLLFAHLPVSIGVKSKKELETVEIAPKVDGKELKKTLKELLDSEAYSTFVGLDGETYTWTEEEKEVILERSGKLFDKLEEEVLLQTLKLYEKAPRDLGLAATGNLSDEDSVAKLEKRVVALAKAVILKRDKESRIQGKVGKAYVEVPDFGYGYETRMAAAKALNDKTGSFSAWSKEAKQSIHAELKKAIEESLNISLFKDFKDNLLSRSLREWYLQEQNLLKLLPPAPKNGK